MCSPRPQIKKRDAGQGLVRSELGRVVVNNHSMDCDFGEFRLILEIFGIM